MKIRAKFVMLFLVIGLLPVVVVGVVAYSTMSSALIAASAGQLQSIAIKQEQRMTNLLQSKQEDVVKLSNQYNLQLALRDYTNSPTKTAKDTLADILQVKKVESPTIQTLLLADMSGRIITSSAIGDDQQPTGTIEVPDMTNTTSASVRKDMQDGFTKLYLTTNVTINKQKTAVLVVVFRTDDLIATVQDYTGLGETGETVVTAKDQVSLFPLRFDTDAALKTDVSRLSLADESIGSPKEAKDYRGSDVLVAAQQMSSTGWLVATKIDKDEALAPIAGLRNGLFVTVLVLSLLIISVALFFTRLLTQPILQISRVAEWIGQGDFLARLEMNRHDEIGSLANSVNVMGDNLNSLVSNIESQRERLQVILDSITEGILAIDAKGNVVLANSAVEKFTHTRADTLTNQNIRDIFTWKRGQQIFMPEYDASATKTYQDLRYVDRAGGEHYAKVIISPVTVQKQRSPTRAIVTIQDETSSHELENMKTDFVSMAAHELRTPLTAVRGYLEVALYKEQHKAADEVIPFVHQALKNVDVLSGLVNNLLDVTRIEKGTLRLTMEKVDLGGVISESVEAMQLAAADKHQVIAYDNLPKKCYVVADPLALHEVVTNLLSNAIKYTPDKGKIVISLEKHIDEYEVTVRDTGAGIPATALPHLFHKFYRVHGGLTSDNTGTGLGLYIAKSILKRHHGSIRVESKLGEGSAFTFLLPQFSEEQLRQMRSVDDAEDTNIRRKRGWVTKNITR